jgi:hypothetical protein
MAKKSKKQKRKAKLQTRIKSVKTFQDNKVLINERKLCIAFPDKTDKLDYLKALALNIDNMIGV